MMNEMKERMEYECFNIIPNLPVETPGNKQKHTSKQISQKMITRK